MWGMPHKLEFGYQFRICPRIGEENSKPWSIWPVAVPYGWKLNSSQQFGIKYTNNFSPILVNLSVNVYKSASRNLFYVHTVDEHKGIISCKRYWKFISNLAGNTLRLRYKHQPVNAVYCENHMEHTNTLSGQNAQFAMLTMIVYIVAIGL
jgi:hypothetical protein